VDKKFLTKEELLKHSNKLIGNSKYAESIFGISLGALFDMYMDHFPNLKYGDIKDIKVNGIQYLNNLAIKNNYIKFTDCMVLYAAVKTLDPTLEKLKKIEKNAFTFYNELKVKPNKDTQVTWAEELLISATSITSSINNEFYDVSFIHDAITEYLFQYILLCLCGYYVNDCIFTNKEKKELLTTYINNERQSI